MKIRIRGEEYEVVGVNWADPNVTDVYIQQILMDPDDMRWEEVGSVWYQIRRNLWRMFAALKHDHINE